MLNWQRDSGTFPGKIQVKTLLRCIYELPDAEGENINMTLRKNLRLSTQDAAQTLSPRRNLKIFSVRRCS